MESLRERILKDVVERKGIDKSILDRINKESKNIYQLKENLIKNNIVNEEEILLIFSKELKIPFFDLGKYKVSSENKEIIPKELAFKYKVFPISKIGEVLTLATANPLDVVAIDDIKMACSLDRVELVLAKEEEIIRFLDELYSQEKISPLLEEAPQDADVQEVSYKGEESLEKVIKESNLPPIIRVVDLIIYEGLKRRASDIHIEPTEKDLSIRYRIDGVLHHGLSLPKINQNAILARLKIMSSLNITEFRVPQDGRFKIKFENREIDFRVSSLPTDFGEKIVLRVLDKESLSLGLKNLGFSPRPLKLFEEALKAPFGIILVTGPTGSGKSTTLYSVITQLNTPDKSIITIEDPVEYQIEGITQIQVNPEIGLTFASCLRSVLRQSPDVIMVGEIRDSETADIAIKASLTGELIFSTLHTNNSVGAITRLVDMGVEPFLVASSLIASTAQRLTRRVCPKCKEEYKPDKELLKRINFPPFSGKLYKGKGCEFCHYTGYRGRTALLEVFSLDDSLREMVAKRASEEELTNYARKHRDFSSLKEDGFIKCIEGVSSLEEVLRVAG
ncbi:MAG: type II secretion system protein GspE [Candidatus Omnitrophota bacterium]|nr:MAG: type II secretion system protein GspE [Candidatus Omnitrophota bacterium]